MAKDKELIRLGMLFNRSAQILRVLPDLQDKALESGDMEELNRVTEELSGINKEIEGVFKVHPALQEAYRKQLESERLSSEGKKIKAPPTADELFRVNPGDRFDILGADLMRKARVKVNPPKKEEERTPFIPPAPEGEPESDLPKEEPVAVSEEKPKLQDFATAENDPIGIIDKSIKELGEEPTFGVKHFIYAILLGAPRAFEMYNRELDRYTKRKAELTLTKAELLEKRRARAGEISKEISAAEKELGDALKEQADIKKNIVLGLLQEPQGVTGPQRSMIFAALGDWNMIDKEYDDAMREAKSDKERAELLKRKENAKRVAFSNRAKMLGKVAEEMPGVAQSVIVQTALIRDALLNAQRRVDRAKYNLERIQLAGGLE